MLSCWEKDKVCSRQNSTQTQTQTQTQPPLPTTTSCKISVPCFTPRQLLIKSHNKTTTTIMKQSSPISLSSQQRVLLFKSICLFFDQNGFSKSLSKFLKETKLEKESWKSCSLNMEEMCYEYLKTRDGAKPVDKAIKQNGGSEETNSEAIVRHKATDVGIGKSKKYESKSSNGSSEQIVRETQPEIPEITGEATLSLPNEPAKNPKDRKKKHMDDSDHLKEEMQEKQVASGDVKKSKKEKKEKSKNKKVEEEAMIPKDSSTRTENEEAQEKQVASHDVEKECKKDKKEKSKIKKVEGKTMNPNDSSTGTKAADKERKSSKKRKLSSEENVAGHVGESAVGDSKRRKTVNTDLSNGEVQPSITPNVSDNGVLEKDGLEKSQKQEKSKQHNGSAEPTSANFFRRVKPEEVEFVDDRLQDNSYWAKGGADSGYGAKAQEVLGQVRGKDFRHEKTKKKRGSYRGGQIDLQTHSVKFQYDDDDE